MTTPTLRLSRRSLAAPERMMVLPDTNVQLRKLARAAGLDPALPLTLSYNYHPWSHVVIDDPGKKILEESMNPSADYPAVMRALMVGIYSPDGRDPLVLANHLAHLDEAQQEAQMRIRWVKAMRHVFKSTCAEHPSARMGSAGASAEIDRAKIAAQAVSILDPKHETGAVITTPFGNFRKPERLLAELSRQVGRIWSIRKLGKRYTPFEAGGMVFFPGTIPVFSGLSHQGFRNIMPKVFDDWITRLNAYSDTLGKVRGLRDAYKAGSVNPPSRRSG